MTPSKITKATPTPSPPDLEGPTVIVAAMAEELAPLASRSRIRRKLRLGLCRVQVGALGNAEVILACTGDGRPLAEQGLRALLEAFQPKRVIVVGVAGGLSPRLLPGDVIVARKVHGSTPESENAIGPDRALTDWAVRYPAAREGLVVSSETILCTADSKAAGWERAKRHNPAVVDLESAAFAEVATEAGLPYLVLRAVCDPAEETLPVDLNACRDETGQVSRIEVFQRVMLSPSIVKALLDLRKRVAVGSTNLASLVDALLNERIR
jgi:adenosylhomocysteine nucleosidase